MDALRPLAPPARAPCRTHPRSSDTSSPPPCSDTPRTPAIASALSSAIFLDDPNNWCEIPVREPPSRRAWTPGPGFFRCTQYPGIFVPCSQPSCSQPPILRLPPAAPHAPARFYTLRRSSCARADRRKSSVLFPCQVAISARAERGRSDLCPTL